MLSLDEAREWLRCDGPDNDAMIAGLLAAVPGYIELTTGMGEEAQRQEPLADTAARFLLVLWFNAEQCQAERLQRTIDSLLKALTVKARAGAG